MAKQPGAVKTNEEQHEKEAMMRVMLEDLLTAQEAAERYGKDDSHMRRLAIEGKIAAVKKGKEWIIDRSSADKYFKYKEETPPRRDKAKT